METVKKNNMGCWAKSTLWLVVLGVLPCLGGCAGTQGHTTADPLESVNRPVYEFNEFLDDNIMEPVADTYVEYIPAPVRGSVSNFYDNLGEINVLLNNFLQGKVKDGFSDTGRFVVNSTVGVLGLFDVATMLGLEKHHEDIGQTFGVWGTGSGPFLTLPFWGPTTVRDTPDIVVSTVTNPLFYVNLPVIVAGVTFAAPLVALSFIDERARLDDSIRIRDEMALDAYVFTREAYVQHRRHLVYDGNPPAEAVLVEAEDFLDELDELDEVDQPEVEIPPTSQLPRRNHDTPSGFGSHQSDDEPIAPSSPDQDLAQSDPQHTSSAIPEMPSLFGKETERFSSIR